MRNWGIIILLLMFWLSCQDDDICTDGSTPNLVVVVRDSLTHEKLELDTLFVEYYLENNHIDTPKLYKKDSFQIPLHLEDTSIRLSFFTSINTSKDSLNMHYTSKTEYVSKACGFKKTFQNIEFNFIEKITLKSIEILQPNINNTDETHINLLF